MADLLFELRAIASSNLLTGLIKESILLHNRVQAKFETKFKQAYSDVPLAEADCREV